jgi:nicotinamidase-related amidase
MENKDNLLSNWKVKLANSPGRKIPQLDGRGALLVLDPQGIFCDSNSPAFLPSWPSCETTIQSLISRFKQQNRPIFITQHQLSEETTQPAFDSLFSHRLTASDPLSQLIPSFASLAVDIVKKSTFSLFTSQPKHRLFTDFDWVLLTGVRTELCVLANACSLNDQGIKPIILMDGTCSKNPFLHLSGLAAAAAGIAHVITMNEFHELENKL